MNLFGVSIESARGKNDIAWMRHQRDQAREEIHRVRADLVAAERRLVDWEKNARWHNELRQQAVDERDHAFHQEAFAVERANLAQEQVRALAETEGLLCEALAMLMWYQAMEAYTK